MARGGCAFSSKCAKGVHLLVKRKAQQLLEKAQQAIEAAELLLEGQKFDFAAGRAYYAMFYVAEALLFEEGIEFRKHTGVHAAFGKHFAKTGRLDPKYHRYLLEAFESRLEADYGVETKLGRGAAEELVRRAKEFLVVGKANLERGEGEPDGRHISLGN